MFQFNQLVSRVIVGNRVIMDRKNRVRKSTTTTTALVAQAKARTKRDVEAREIKRKARVSRRVMALANLKKEVIVAIKALKRSWKPAHKILGRVCWALGLNWSEAQLLKEVIWSLWTQGFSNDQMVNEAFGVVK